MDYRLRNLLILDIETVALTKEYQKLNADLRKHWERKSSFLRNEDELTSEELFSEKAGIYAEFGKVITVAFGIFHDLPDGSLALRVKSVTGHDEAALLKEIKDLLETIFDPENLRLCAHNGKEFDFPYLRDRKSVV